MSMRVNTIITHLRPEDAITLIEFLDQVRDVLAQTYDREIRAMMQEATTTFESDGAAGEDESF